MNNFKIDKKYQTIIAVPLRQSSILNLFLIAIIAVFNTSCSNWDLKLYNSRQTIDKQARFSLNNRPDFFEKGRLQIEQEMKQLETQKPQSVLTIESGQIEWQKFIFKEGDFTIWMPTGGMTAEKEIIETENGNINFKVFASHPESARFVVAYSDVLNSKQLADKQDILVRVQHKIIDVTDFKLSRNDSYNSERFSVREFVLANNVETITFRVYLAERRLYMIGASEIETENEIPGAVEKFLDSFKLN
ncbi:MAG: hypothetical protein F6K25_02805 [Okeania sp. SIO2G4]|uniref:hypothetical protein n=1 Tax=unclassified Okeania TaxID=2634635 RepID=UPI0013BA95B4|nr:MULTISPECIES: hypothetical protein [unclassified Okeania]NEP71425.1 hypothetical protein [Okeania sp. SIO2G5]NEP96083.1 hypothetical protein [Okeania sp. SIO2F5]NEQ89728.1 hypothetical protein [Okeania sp. SIO2G4]